MISSFSDDEYLIRGRPQPRSYFFSAAAGRVPARQQPPSACALPDAASSPRRWSGRVTRQAAFAGFEKLLRPAVVQALGDAFTAAQLSDAGFSPQAVQHNADLLFRGILLAGRPTDVSDQPLRTRRWLGGFLAHLHSFVVTMGQKSSPPQSILPVS